MLKNDPILHPVAIPQVMINFAANHGIDQDTCLQGTDITEEILQDSEALITRNQEMRLIENLILALPDEPALGFKLGLQYNIATFGIWGFALRTSRTLRDAATRALQYLPLSTAYCRVYRFEDAEHYGLCMDPESIPLHLRQFLLERDMATGLNLMRELSLAGVSISSTELQGKPPEYADLIEKLSGLKPIYNSPRNAMLIKLSNMDKPLPTFDANLVRMLDEQCRLQLERRKTTGLAEQVRKQLLGPLGLVAVLDDVACALALSPRSLRRKLEQEGTSFRSIVEEERRQIALQLLTCSNMILDELAIHIGYTDTASFTRAFRRWMSCSPGEYRKNNSR
ncbi:AraC family transcriptional regulator [Gammaproteobacteria bacterium 42_54_T18]|nr:AraC family transcriptional regulator [Gammaproteobacteria bacterium 42_54_T18]